MPVYFKGDKITPIVKDTSLFKKRVDRTITEVTAEDLQGVTSIGIQAFRDCNLLTSIVIPNSVTEIGSTAFAYCNLLTSIVIPNSVTAIGSTAFQNCTSLTSIILPNRLQIIRSYMFQSCTSLTSVVIGNSVTRIDAYVFQNCTGLTSITINTTTPPTLVNANAFDSTNNCPIYVPAESVAAYKAATNWTSLADRIFAIP